MRTILIGCIVNRGPLGANVGSVRFEPYAEKIVC